MGQIEIVVGGQFGSEGKGAVGARIGRTYNEGDAFVRVAGPNAGHTAYDSNGVKFAFRQLPVASVVNEDALIVIAAGSEIDPPVLEAEIQEAEEAGHKIRHRLYVDYSATVITNQHKAAETALIGAVGSTGKGIGAARAERLMRKAQTYGQWLSNPALDGTALAEVGSHWGTQVILNTLLHNGGKIMVEGTQGYGLGLHGAHYPQCTSSDTRAIDFLAMAGINPWGHEVRVLIATRVYPIRVAGNSGALKGESSWADLNLPEEYTTVTKKVRRVGQWDSDLIRDAVRDNGPSASEIALTMVDQLDPSVAGWDDTYPYLLEELPAKVQEFVAKVEAETGVRVTLIGTSPTTMIEVAR